MFYSSFCKVSGTVEPCYNDMGLCDTSAIKSGMLWHCTDWYLAANHNIIYSFRTTLVSNNTNYSVLFYDVTEFYSRTVHLLRLQLLVFSRTESTSIWSRLTWKSLTSVWPCPVCFGSERITAILRTVDAARLIRSGCIPNTARDISSALNPNYIQVYSIFLHNKCNWNMYKSCGVGGCVWQSVAVVNSCLHEP